MATQTQFTSYDEAIKSQTGQVIASLKLDRARTEAMLISAGVLKEPLFSVYSYISKKSGKPAKVVKVKGQFAGVSLKTFKLIAENAEEAIQLVLDYPETFNGSNNGNEEVQ